MGRTETTAAEHANGADAPVVPDGARLIRNRSAINTP